MVELTVVNMVAAMEVMVANTEGTMAVNMTESMEVMEANMVDAAAEVMVDMAGMEVMATEDMVGTVVTAGMADTVDGTVDGITIGGEKVHIGVIMAITIILIISTPRIFIIAIIHPHTIHTLIATITITMHRSITTFIHKE